MAEHYDGAALLASGPRASVAATASVACGSCTACCRGEAVILTARDNPRLYETIPVTNPITGGPARMIPHKADGTCLYLGAEGCKVYGHRPEICRAFTCVGWVNRIVAEVPRAERRRDMRAGLIDREVWEAGMARRGEAA